MNYNNFPTNVAILGAAGKMGSGITLLVSLEMTNLKLSDPEKYGDLKLYAVDISDEALAGLRKYIAKQSARRAEKDLEKIKNYYQSNSDLDTDEKVIDAYTKDVDSTIISLTNLDELKNTDLIFEAVSENVDLKAKLINNIKSNCENLPVVFTNTSSIPIKELEDKTDLKGRVVGFHFYNPPAVQKLVELITTVNTDPEIEQFAKDLAASMKKIIVPSNDIAGFIGNGHFMRDLLYAFKQIDNLKEDLSFSEAVYLTDFVAKKLLVRPMGIFQLSDYVGLDVCKNILAVMNDRIEGEELQSELLDKVFEKGILGGQNHDGSQKDGILKYEEGRIKGVYDLDIGEYVPVEDLKEKVHNKIGNLPDNLPVWKEVIKNPDKENILKEYFKELFSTETFGANFTKYYLINSKAIGNQLVESGVTNSAENVNNVLLLGFFHAYGPVNDFC